eukprot:11183650-Lingulodinium_polyedra.AAC.1
MPTVRRPLPARSTRVATGAISLRMWESRERGRTRGTRLVVLESGTTVSGRSSPGKRHSRAK